MPKPYFYRDGAIVDGVPSRVQYTVALMSDLPIVGGAFVDSTRLWRASVNPVDIHNNGSVLQVTESRADSGWATIGGAGNGATYTGSPDYVHGVIDVQVNENAASNYWALPEIIALRNGVRIGAASALMMQNNGAYSAQSTLAAAFIDPAPGTNPVYTFILEDDDNRTVAAVPQPHSHVALIAIEKVEVLTP